MTAENSEQDGPEKEIKVDAKDSFYKNSNLLIDATTEAVGEYTQDWHLLHEPLQNAIDSFVVTGEDSITPIENYTSGEDHITVIFDLDGGDVGIYDRGSGIAREKLDFLVTPDKSMKKFRYKDRKYRRMIKGHAGIGLKSSIYASERFTIISKKGINKPAGLRKKDAWKFKEQDFSWKFTNIKEDEAEERANKMFPNGGTSVRIRHRVPDTDSNWLIGVAITSFLEATRLTKQGSDWKLKTTKQKVEIIPDLPHILEWYFRTQTYAACMSRTLPDSSVLELHDLNIAIRIKNSNSRKIKGIPIGESKLKDLCCKFKLGYWNPSEKFDSLTSRTEKRTFRLYDGTWEELVLEEDRKRHAQKIACFNLSKDDITAMLRKWKRDKSGFKVQDNQILDKHKAALERINGALLVVGRSDILRRFARLPTGKIRLSVNGLVTTRDLDNPGSGFKDAIHVVLDYDHNLTRNKLPSGGYAAGDITPESRGGTEIALSSLFEDLWPNINQMAYNVGADQKQVQLTYNRFKQDELISGIPEEQLHRTILEEYFCRANIPWSENDVIQAMATLGEKMKLDIKWLAVHAGRTFDGAIQSGDMFKQFSNEREWVVTEFKLDLKGFFENELKSGHPQSIRHIDLLILWNADPDAVESGYSLKWLDQDESKTNYPEDEKMPNNNDYRKAIESGLGRMVKGADVQGSLDQCIVLSLKEVYDSLIESSSSQNNS